MQANLRHKDLEGNEKISTKFWIDKNLNYTKSSIEIEVKKGRGVFCRVLLLFKNYITVLSVVFLLFYSFVENVTYNIDFQKGSIIFSYLNGKGGSEAGKELVVVKNEEIKKNQQVASGYVPIAKIASADSKLMLGRMNTSFNIEELQKSEDRDSNKNRNDLVEKFTSRAVLVQNSFYLSTSNYYDSSLSDLKYGIVKYEVQNGDTPSSIATSFGISTYTVLWANNLKVGDYIKPGQILEILPVTGVKHITVENETIENIALKYKADKDEIILFNNLPADGSLIAGKVLVIPNGEKEAPLKPRRRIASNNTKLISSKKIIARNYARAKGGHKFPYGYCTWYVSTKVYVPWGGHAKSWLANARAFGYNTGKSPAAGSIVVTTENRWYGHVAYVESVHKNTITISEMNYIGWGRKSVRVLPINSPVIRGYIYY